jgi:hypothetical protein
MRSTRSVRRSQTPAGVVVLGVVTAAFACRVPVAVERAPGTALRCENDICTEVVSFGSRVTHVGIWIEAPAGTRMLNARMAADDQRACQGKFPVAWVKVDETVYPKGPIDIAGQHGVVLDFPFNTWFNHSGYWRDMFVDLQLEVAGATRCVRMRLTDDHGKEAVGP